MEESLFAASDSARVQARDADETWQQRHCGLGPTTTAALCKPPLDS